MRIAWSPDGETIACPAGNADFPGDNKYEVVAVSLKDGTQRPLTREKWAYIGGVAWLGDGSGLVLVGLPQLPGMNQVWHLSDPGGEARRISNDFNFYVDLDVTADSSTLVTVQGDRLSNVWVAPDADAARARRITDGRSDGLSGLAWTPDGRVVFVARVGDNTDVWITDAGGGNRRRLTDYAGYDTWPSVSPDGRYVVFELRRGDRLNIWRMDNDGSNPVRLTDGNVPAYPHCSPDGRWVYYADTNPGDNYASIWRVPIEGGVPVRVTDKASSLPRVSPDGKWLAYVYADLQATPPFGLAVGPAEGGPPVHRLGINHETGVFGWTPDSRALAYLEQRSMNVWAQPIDGGQARQLTDFKTDQTFFFDFSRDGRALALARGTQASDVVLITDFR